jgi:hypothetical protein
MRHSWVASIVPNGADDTVYLVVDCYGLGGCVWREADTSETDLETVIADLDVGPVFRSAPGCRIQYRRTMASHQV